MSTPRKRSIALIVSSFAAGLAIVATIVAFQAQRVRTDEKFCTVLYQLVARSGATVGKPGTPGFAYYQAHPTELAAAREQNNDFLHDLPCHPKGPVQR